MSKNNNKNNQSPINDNSGVIEKIHAELIKVLSIIFLNDRTVKFLPTNNYFKKLIVKLLFVGKVIETTYSIKKDDNNIDNSIVAYENITKSNFEKDVQNFDIKFNLTGNVENDNLEIIDEINWVKTYLYNSMNLDWNDLIKDTTPINNSELVVQTANKSSTNDNVETVNADKINNDDYRQNNTYNSQRHYQNAEDFLAQNNISIDSVANQIIDQQSSMLLQKDIFSGKFYQYNSKPRFFPALKIGLLGLWVSFFVVFLIYCIFEFVIADKIYQLKPGLGTVGSDGVVIIQQNLFTNDNFFVVGNTSIASIMFLVMFIVLASLYIYKMFSNWKNQNTKYSFKSMVSWLIVIVGVFVIIIPAFTQSSILTYHDQMVKAIDIPSAVVKFNPSNFSATIDNAKNFPLFNTTFILTILLIALIGLITIWTIILMIMRPKLDTERMQAKMDQYRRDIKDGKIIIDENGNLGSGFFNSPRSPFSPF